MDHLSYMVKKYPDLDVCIPDIQSALDILSAAFRQGKKLLVCGNGGSAADSEHIVGELMKGFRLRRRLPKETCDVLAEVAPEHSGYLAEHLQGALPAISLVSQVSLATAFANDVAADLVFAQMVFGYGVPGDVLLGLTTSGSSTNILYAFETGRALGLKTIAMVGHNTDVLRPRCDVVISVPRDSTADVQEGHQAIYHALCAMLEEAFFTP